MVHPVRPIERKKMLVGITIVGVISLLIGGIIATEGVAVEDDGIVNDEFGVYNGVRIYPYWCYEPRHDGITIAELLDRDQNHLRHAYLINEAAK